VQNNQKKIAIVHTGTDLFQLINDTLRNTEGYDVVNISESAEDIFTALNDSDIDSIVYDLKNETELNLTLHKAQSKQSNNNLLTPRENEIMLLLDKGMLYKEISETRDVTLGTLKQYIHTIYEKLGVSNKTEAINKYFNR
jgi:DNA-binding NarL/FixJ family response regulator